MEEKEISRAVISRLPRYLHYLGELDDRGVERISSQELSEQMNVTASQIRQDLNNFGGFGQQGYGYNVRFLYEEIGKILGLDKTHNLILVGAGNLGQALAGYENFGKRGFIIRGIFDKNERIVGEKIRNIPIMSMRHMTDFVKENNIDIAVIAIPKLAAVEVAEELSTCGIKAIWNFSHVDLKVPQHIVVENVHLSESLMKLSYNIREKECRSEEQ
ncbi:redox-sensing transcriptional repressor Rex [bacterium C-53]|nr:redox-sensing transcriptional repressor Rex [Lachnospiraceae bacterium]NBI03513.1 redox-sensing transcriptional repressor Rex [Lachnospiraceae bacterium]RKJ09513.1 redox-sensing transcriptional repressor Rex [bacterium C-53]